MDSFDVIFDRANSEPHTAATAPSRKERGRAFGIANPTLVPPVLDSNPPTAVSAKTFCGAQPKRSASSRSKDSAKSGKPRKATCTAKPSWKTPSSATNIDGQEKHETQTRRAVDVDHGRHLAGATQTAGAPVIDEIRYMWRMRQRWHRAEKSLILQGKAICRAFLDGDKTAASAAFEFVVGGGVHEIEGINIGLMPFIPAINGFAVEREKFEKHIFKIMKALPTYEWAKSIHGFGPIGFASIIGEAGAVGEYKSVSALWKRMGLAVINGERQRKKANLDEAIEHGYSPQRRAVIWNIGGGLIGAMGRGPRPMVGEDISTRDDLNEYQKLFIDRCRYLAAREPEKFARDPVEKADKKTGEIRIMESYSKHCASAAKRYVEKRFLRSLYAQWRLETKMDEDLIALPLAAE